MINSIKQCINYLSIMKFWFIYLRLIYMRNNLFKIWHSSSNLVVFATIETKSSKRGKKLITHNQECEKIIDALNINN